MADFKPLIYSVAFLLFVGLFVPFLLGFFIDVSEIDASDSLTAPLIDIVEDGFEIGVIPFVDFDNFDINPFSWLGDGLHQYFLDSLTILSILPNWLIAMILILTILCIITSLLTLIPGI